MNTKIFSVVVALGIMFSACNKNLSDASEEIVGGVKAKEVGSSIVWNGQADKDVAANIDAVQNDTRKNASGPKITSNAHSADFPGIYFIWDSKQKDNGYLKVDAAVFDKFSGFTLTSKESNTYWDFAISVQTGQETTADGCYVFFIPKVYNNKNINMVFISDFVEKAVTPEVVNLGFIGYYMHDGKVLSTSPFWLKLEEGDCIDWKFVDAAYAEWVAQGGLEPDRTLWQTSGYASFTFEDNAEICFGDFNLGQLEDYYKAYYVDPGYKLLADPVNLGFIGYYIFEGKVLSTSIHWQLLEKEGDMIDWDAVDAAYDAWVAKGGLAPDRTLWKTSGYAAFTFADYAALGFGDFNKGQVEGFYKTYYVAPGYILPEQKVETDTPFEFEVTVFHREIRTGKNLLEAVFPNGENFKSDDEEYIKFLNAVDGFTFIDGNLLVVRSNNPGGFPAGYTCKSVSKVDDDLSFDLEQQLGTVNGVDGIQALVKPVSEGHYQITFWYRKNKLPISVIPVHSFR